MISGPSGVGKGSVLGAIRRRYPALQLSVSATTRPRRPHEVDGVHYHFVDESQFDALLAAGDLLESAEFAGHRYGTPAQPVREALARGADVLLEIEVAGARQVRAHSPEAVLVLLVPPSLEELAARLRGRGTETEEAVRRRLEVARRELAEADLFDHVVVNDRLDRAVDEVDRILRAAAPPPTEQLDEPSAQKPRAAAPPPGTPQPAANHHAQPSPTRPRS